MTYKKLTALAVSAAMSAALLPGMTGYAEEGQAIWNFTPQAVASAGGWNQWGSNNHGTRYDEFHLGGQGTDALNGYNDAESHDGQGDSHDTKVGFARFDLSEETHETIKYELLLSDGRESNDKGRLGDITLIAATVDPTTTVCEGKTPFGENWVQGDNITWNNRPRLSSNTTDPQNVIISTPASADVTIDVTDLIKDKSGTVTLAVLGQKSGGADAEIIYDTVELKKTLKLNEGEEWNPQPERTPKPAPAAEIKADMGGRSALTHGATGYLYGAAEINVPSIDLLYGLKPDTMVQKAMDGLQHPTGDAAGLRCTHTPKRTESGPCT